MESKYVIDSSVFIAFYYEGDVNHSIAVAILKNLKDCKLIVHPYVVSEVATVLSYKISKLSANKFILDIYNAGNTTQPTLNLKEESDFFLSQNKKMSFVDTTLVYLAKKSNAHLVTFDKQMISLFKK